MAYPIFLFFSLTLTFSAQASRYLPGGIQLCREIMSSPVQNAHVSWEDVTPQRLPPLDDNRAFAFLAAKFSWERPELRDLEHFAREMNIDLPVRYRFENFDARPRVGQNLIARGRPNELQRFLREGTSRDWFDAGQTSVLAPADLAPLPNVDYGPRLVTLTKKHFAAAMQTLLNAPPVQTVTGLNLPDLGFLLVRLSASDARRYLDHFAGTPLARRPTLPIAVETLTIEDLAANLSKVMKGEFRVVLLERNRPKAALISIGEYLDYARAGRKKLSALNFPHRLLTPAQKTLLTSDKDELVIVAEDDYGDVSQPPRPVQVVRRILPPNASQLKYPISVSLSVLTVSSGWRDVAQENSKLYLSKAHPARTIVYRADRVGGEGRTNTAFGVMIRADRVRGRGVEAAKGLISELAHVDLADDQSEVLRAYAENGTRPATMDLLNCSNPVIAALLRDRGVTLIQGSGEDIYFLIKF